MICPYQRPSTYFSEELNNEYNAEGQITKTTRCFVERINPLECSEKGCGAWKDGECGFYFDIPASEIEGENDDGSERFPEIRE